MARCSAKPAALRMEAQARELLLKLGIVYVANCVGDIG